MRKVFSFFLAVPLLFLSATAVSQSISNTSNTVTFNVTSTDCSIVPPSGNYTLDISYFDFSIGDWVNLTSLAVTVSAGTSTFTIDCSGVTPAVNFPYNDFINSVGNIKLTKTGYEYLLYWDTDYLSCTPLGN